MGGGGFSRPGSTIGQNPPAGVMIQYYLKEKPEAEIKLEILDSKGDTVRTFKSKTAVNRNKEKENSGFYGDSRTRNMLPAKAGMNRFVWNTRYPDAIGLPNLILWGGSLTGPIAVPGKYQARLIVGEKKLTTTFEIKKDPRLKTTPDQFQAQFDLLIKIRDKVSLAHEAVEKIREIRNQTKNLANRIKNKNKQKTITEAADIFNKKLSVVEEEIIQIKIKSNQDPLNFPIKLNNKIAALTGTVAGPGGAPTKQMYAVFEDLSDKLDLQLNKMAKIIGEELPKFNQLVKNADIPAVILKDKIDDRP